MTGFSQGSMMTFRMICAHADAFASVGSAAGGGCFEGGAAPAAEVPILYVHGESDAIVAFSTGQAQRDHILAAWSFGAPTVFAQTADYSATRWTTAAGTDFEFWQHRFEAGFPSYGHCLPGPESDGGAFRCRGAGQFDYSMELLRFFTAHPR